MAARLREIAKRAFDLISADGTTSAAVLGG
jgi:hypothetical protein